MSYTPVIILPGIGQSKVQVVDAGGNAIRDAWPLSVDAEKAIGPLKGPLMKMMLFRRDAGFSDAAAKVVGDFADDLTSYPDGSTKYPLKAVRWDFPVSDYDSEQKRYLNKMVPITGLAEEIGEENIFFFAYHSFGDVYRTCDELDAYIQMVKQRTGSDRVNLMAVSLGGVLALAYFDKYGSKCEVKRLVNVVAATSGTHLISDIMTANFNLDDPRKLVREMGGTAEETFGDMLDMVPAGVVEATLSKCAAAIVERVAVNSTMMWGVVPRDHYSELKEKYLTDGRHDRIAADADRIYAIHTDPNGFVAKLKTYGTEVYSLCAYGKRLFPLCASGDVMSDGIVDSASSSMGAVFAAPGEAFPEDYTPVVPDCADAVSPDRMVDASACVAPDQTWFFANQGHDEIAYNDVALKIVGKLLCDDSFNSVYADPAFPRFNGNRNTKKLVRDLYPRFQRIDRESLSESRKKRYDEIAADYEAFMAKTVITDDGETEEMEREMNIFLALIEA